MGRTKPQFSALAVFEVEHDPLASGVALPTPALLPELSRVQLRQQGFLGAGAVHLLAHHGGDLLQHPPHQGEVGVDP